MLHKIRRSVPFACEGTEDAHPPSLPRRAPRLERLQSGFSLLELAVVLVIIGLLAGGVLVGQTMIRQSQLREVANELDRHAKAIKLFQDKYLAVPGDMSNAESYWGSDSGCPATTTNTVTKTATCNGDGNGRIGIWNADTGATSTQYEWFRAWQHLANAGLIAGAYTGVTASSGGVYSSRAGSNVPISALSGGGWSLVHYINNGGVSPYYAASYQHVFMLGIDAVNGINTGAILTPAEALDLDTKIDDGKPAYGNLMARKSAAEPNCATNDTAASASYNGGYPGIACAPIFISGF